MANNIYNNPYHNFQIRQPGLGAMATYPNNLQVNDEDINYSRVLDNIDNQSSSGWWKSWGRWGFASVFPKFP